MKKNFFTLFFLGVFVFSMNILTANAVQFSYLDAAYEQEIYGEVNGYWSPGAWTAGGEMIARQNSQIKVFSLAQDAIAHGTLVHSSTTYNVSGLGGGRGMTNGTDGNIYANTSLGLQTVDLGTMTASTIAGTATGSYGIATLGDGRIVHNTSSAIYVYDPGTGIDTLIYSAGTFIDDIAVSPTGEIFLAALSATDVIIINSSGVHINTVDLGAYRPDGMAFGDGAAFTNNTNGTITRLDFAGAGYTGAATITEFASGGNYGDLAAVGPDGAFYVSQWLGTNWDDGYTGSHSIVKLSLIGGGGGFDPGAGVDPGAPVPEPGTLLLLGSGLIGMVFFRRKFA